ncbi:MAG: preprotein translocase subunit YajC [bacterium]
MNMINWMAAAPLSGGAGQPAWAQFVPFIIIFVLFYFLLIRPQTKKQKEHDALVKAVKTGDKVIAAGGIHGVVANVKEQSVLLKVAEGVKIEVQKSSITLVTKSTEQSE